MFSPPNFETYAAAMMYCTKVHRHRVKGENLINNILQYLIVRKEWTYMGGTEIFPQIIKVERSK